MPILAASSGMVMPGCPCTNERACSERVPLPLRRPARRRPVVAGLAGAEAALARRPDPRGRPGPRRAGVVALLELDPPTPANAEEAASKRLYSSTSGFSSASRFVISSRFSSRKSVTIAVPSLGELQISPVTLHHRPVNRHDHSPEEGGCTCHCTLHIGRRDGVTFGASRAACAGARASTSPLAREFPRRSRGWRARRSVPAAGGTRCCSQTW